MTYFLPRMENTAFAALSGGGRKLPPPLRGTSLEEGGKNSLAPFVRELSSVCETEGVTPAAPAGKFSQNGVKISVKNENSVRKIPENS